MNPDPRPHRSLSPLAVLAIVVAIAAAVAAVLSGFGYRFGWWPLRMGFSVLRWSVYGAIVAIVLGLIAAFAARPGAARRGFPLALAALALGVLIAAVPMSFLHRARSVPPIHDITTDPSDPPQFVAVLPLRKDAPNAPEYGGAKVAAQQAEAYPDIQPLRLSEAPAQAFTDALAVARDMGWDIVASVPQEGRIEATATTRWFGFKDDVVVRVRPDGTGSRVDVRSESRVGGSDVGTNAARIREYVGKLRDRAAHG